MSISEKGMFDKIENNELSIKVKMNHPLMKLAEVIKWEELKGISLPDLKETEKGKWWLGRKLELRIHLSVYILQQLTNKTDRQMEEEIRDNAAYQLFCGRSIIEDWHCPDHTKIEEFRSRLRPDTQRRIANAIALLGVKLGYGNCKVMDIDSTIQLANMSYPSDVNLMVKLSKIAFKIRDYLKEQVTFFAHESWNIDLKSIKSKAREYFFNKCDKKKENLIQLWHRVYNVVQRIRNACECLVDYDIKQMPWNIKRAVNQLQEFGHKYLLNVISYITDKELNKSKLLSFNLKEVGCFSKGKLSKDLSFGRSIQLGRIEGNFLLTCGHDTVRMEDKHSVGAMIKAHEEIFGNNQLESVSLDKGYYSKSNKQLLVEAKIKEIGLQQPGSLGSLPDLSEEIKQKLVNRRAGIEPLIGHVKNKWQLRKSRMKSDRTILASAYSSILGFNLHQMARYLTGKAQINATS